MEQEKSTYQVDEHKSNKPTESMELDQATGNEELEEDSEIEIIELDDDDEEEHVPTKKTKGRGGVSKKKVVTDEDFTPPWKGNLRKDTAKETETKVCIGF
jgi:hypothetical protein